MLLLCVPLLQRALQGDFPIIYITPEKAANWDDGLAALHKNAGIAFFAIDESHCVAEWGKGETVMKSHLRRPLLYSNFKYNKI